MALSTITFPNYLACRTMVTTPTNSLEDTSKFFEEIDHWQNHLYEGDDNDGDDVDDNVLSSSSPSSSSVVDKSTISSIVASYGSSSATAWLEFDRYHIWQAELPKSKKARFLLFKVTWSENVM
ncbi:hypothetical protein DFH05DRAFT_1521580 [Lentinula detonsa]|uniref:Uncharacterized protein n=1 Tax=Lentinula detonsa TaxID=2804962 RepID=A0A9W8P544_9AGAR|nr:hypothetical protein DFH05DRAFT_1521580 [Lentinula detonsa]